MLVGKRDDMSLKPSRTDPSRCGRTVSDRHHNFISGGNVNSDPNLKMKSVVLVVLN